MAEFYNDNFNTRYRLYFSDIDGNPKRLDIDQKDYTGEIQSIVGTGNPVILKYSSGDILKKFIFGSKCTINLYKQFDDEYVKFHEFPEKEFKIRIYNGITRYQYHKLNILCPNTNLEAHPLANDTNNYAERIAYVEDSYISGVPDEIVDVNFDKYATNKNKFINRVVFDGGAIDNEDAVLANEITEVSDSYYQMYWQGYLVADTFKEEFKPYPTKIQLTAIDMLATIDELLLSPYGYSRTGGAQSYFTDPSDYMANLTYDMGDILSRYFLDGATLTGETPINSLYNYIFFEMEGLNGDLIQSNTSTTRNYYGFDDRFTYNFSAAAKTARTNVVGQQGTMDANYKTKKGKDVVGNLLSYCNARVYQCWGQIYVSPIGSDNGIVDNTPDMQNANTGKLNMMYGLGQDIKNYMSAAESNKTKYHKIAYRRTGNGTNSGTGGYKYVMGYIGEQCVKKVKDNLQPVKNDFKVEYLAPFKQINLEVDRSSLNKSIGQIARNPSMEFRSGYTTQNGQIQEMVNPQSGRKSWNSTSFYIGNDYNVLPKNSSNQYIPAIRTQQRTFNSTGQDQRLRVQLGKPIIKVRLSYYVDADISGTTVPDLKLYYFVDLDTRESVSQSTTDRDYYYDQNDRRWEKSTRFNFVELKSPTDFNKWGTVNLTIEDWDLYNAQPNGISFMRGEIGVLGCAVKSGTQSGFNRVYCDNFDIQLDYLYPTKDNLRNINTATPNTKSIDLKRIPWREINERGGGFDYQRVIGSTTNRYTGNLVDNAREILSLYSAFVSRYEFTCRDKYNNFNFSNRLYINFKNHQDDSLSYIDGLTYNVKKNEQKIIAHKGTFNKLDSFSVGTFSDSLVG